MWLARMKLSHMNYSCLQKKKLQEKCYEKNLTGLMRHFPSFTAPVQGKDFVGPPQALAVCVNTSFHTILYLPVFCQ